MTPQERDYWLEVYGIIDDRVDKRLLIIVLCIIALLAGIINGISN